MIPLGNDEGAARCCLWSRCLAAEESYWEIFPSIERNISPKESGKFLGDVVVRLKLLVSEED